MATLIDYEICKSRAWEALRAGELKLAILETQDALAINREIAERIREIRECGP